MEKNFDSWNHFKQKVDQKINIAHFKEREVWWCNLGVNIGDEENGKNHTHSRPVLVVKKFNKRIFWGLPLTSQIKEKNYYHKINFENKEQCVMLSQLRLWDAKRLTSKMGRLNDDKFLEIKKIISDLILGQN